MIRTAEIAAAADTAADPAAAKRAAKAAKMREYRAAKKAQAAGEPDAITAGLKAIEAAERAEADERAARDAADWARLAAEAPAQTEAGTPLAPSEGTAHRIDDIPPGLKRLRNSDMAERLRQAALDEQETARAEAAAKIAAEANIPVTVCKPVKALRDMAKRREEIEAQVTAKIQPAPEPLKAEAAAADRGTCRTKEAAQAAGRLFYGAGNFRIKPVNAGREYYWGPIEAPAPKAAKAAAAPAAKPALPTGQEARKDAPKPGTATRAVYDMLTRPEGATAKEMAAAGLKDRSVASDVRALAARYGLGHRIEKDGKFDRCWLIAKTIN